MPHFLQRRRGASRVQVTPCWLREEDAKAAAADLENVEVAGGWWADLAVFPKRIAFSDRCPRELMAQRWWGSEVEREMDRYYELCRSGAHSGR